MGDAVSVIPGLSMYRWPSYGEVATFPAELVVGHPPGLSWEEAAAAWIQYVTAYGALIEAAGLKAGEFVAITAASSSVGLAAIQVAKHIGARPIALTRTGAKRRALLDAGAVEVVAFREEPLVGRLAEIVGDQGLRVVSQLSRLQLHRPGAATATLPGLQAAVNITDHKCRPAGALKVGPA